MRVSLLVLVLGGLLLALPRAADAHFTLLAPMSWTTEASGKGPSPCGDSTPATNAITPVQGGHPLMIQVRETIPHRGHYRIALAVNSRSELPPEPAVKNRAGMVITTGTSDSAVIQTPAVFPVLEDGVFAHPGTVPNMMFQKEIMLPNLTCAKCTLQIIEFMADHAPDYFYRHCADLKITADPALPPFQAGGADGGSDAAAVDASDAGGGAGGSGGMAGTGGKPGTGGSAGSGGTTGAGTGGSTTGTGGSGPPPSSGGGGGCSVVAGTPGGVAVALGLLGLALLARRRRRSISP